MDLFWPALQPEPRLCTATRPRGGDWLADDLARLRALRVDVVVSCLERAEAVEVGLADEAAACAAAGLGFVNIAIADRGVPDSVVGFVAVVGGVVDRVDAGARVVVHCRMGVGRSSLVVAAGLIAGGVEEAVAWDAIAAARGRPVPDVPAQRAWLARAAPLLARRRSS